MKSRFFVLIVLLASISLRAQNDIDAMRYSQTSFYGDARYMSMGGAFGSLGANISCINSNPAGIAMYHKGELVFTPGFNFQGENATHYGTKASDFSAKINISNIGFVAAWNQRPQAQYYFNQQNNNERYGPGSNNNSQNQPKKDVQPQIHRWAFGLNFNRIADFNYHTTINGYAKGSSIMNAFRDAANGYGPNQLDPYYEGAAWQSYLINNTTDSTHYNTWTDYVNNEQVLQQTKTIQSSGRIGEFALALAHSFNDKFYLGAGIGVPVIKYKYQSTYTESDYNNSDPNFSNLQYQENLSTSGVGINFKGGLIYRFNSGIKIGVYAQSPSYYKLSDNYQNSISANYHQNIIPILYPGDDSDYVTSGSYTSPLGTYSYHLNTPGRVGLSISYVLGKILAFSVDGEYMDYSKAKFSDSQSYLNTYVNPVIQNKYTGTANLKAGIELNTRPIVFRVGFASYGSPFGNVLAGNYVRNTFTGGIGFRSAHAVYFDMGFAYTMWKEQYYLIDPMYIQPSNVKYNTMYITATLGIKFN